jgi:F0F1-type ATP synthase assembly protein I
MALTIVWVALASLGVLAIAVGGGLWLDHRLGTRPAFTILFVLVSFPITLLSTIRIVSWTVRPAVPARPASPDEGPEHDRRNLN